MPLNALDEATFLFVHFSIGECLTVLLLNNSKVMIKINVTNFKEDPMYQTLAEKNKGTNIKMYFMLILESEVV